LRDTSLRRLETSLRKQALPSRAASTINEAGAHLHVFLHASLRARVSRGHRVL
jgi:hypothetical protein